jgi:hypothetical protein
MIPIETSLHFPSHQKSEGAIQSDGQMYRGASFASFSPAQRGEGRDEGFCLTFNGVISSLHRNEILRLPITLNRTPESDQLLTNVIS